MFVRVFITKLCTYIVGETGSTHSLLCGQVMPWVFLQKGIDRSEASELPAPVSIENLNSFHVSRAHINIRLPLWKVSKEILPFYVYRKCHYIFLWDKSSFSLSRSFSGGTASISFQPQYYSLAGIKGTWKFAQIKVGVWLGNFHQLYIKVIVSPTAGVDDCTMKKEKTDNGSVVVVAEEVSWSERPVCTQSE